MKKRLEKASDLNYYNELVAKVTKSRVILNEIENIKKVSDFIEKKERSYRSSPVKQLDVSSEIEYLNTKRQLYIQKITKFKESLENNRKIIEENQKKIESLQKEQKLLSTEIGESYFTQKSKKKMLNMINKKEKIRTIIMKEKNSKLNLMISKIKSLQSELKSLKNDESQVSNQYWTATSKIDEMQEAIRRSPLLKYNNYENRSRSVKPKFHPMFFTEIIN